MLRVSMSLPLHSHPPLVRLPRQLNNPQHIARLARLDLELALAQDRIRQALVQPNPVARQTGRLATVLLRLGLVRLERRVKLLVRRQRALQTRRLLAKGWVERLDALRNLLFLRTRAPLLPLCLSATQISVLTGRHIP